MDAEATVVVIAKGSIPISFVLLTVVAVSAVALVVIIRFTNLDL